MRYENVQLKKFEFSDSVGRIGNFEVGSTNELVQIANTIRSRCGYLSIFPALFYYGILSMRGASCTSNTPAGHLILIIIMRIYCVVKEKELVKEW